MIRRNPIEKKINHERWLVSYADFITLLFAFFVVMYSISAVNETKYRELTETLSSAFSSTALESSENREQSQDKKSPEKKPELADLSDISAEIATALAGEKSDGTANISKSEEWVEIELNASVLFSSGKATLQEEAQSVLTSVADLLKEYDNAVVVEGHTDNVPISNAEFTDNWSLSAARAVSVVNALTKNNVNPLRLSAVGMGEHRPIEANDTADGREKNRRVVLRVSRLATPETEKAILEDADKNSEINREAGSTENLDGSEISGTNQRKGASNGEGTSSEKRDGSENESLDPVRLQGGGLLFTSDPNLPRTDPPVNESPQPSPAESSNSESAQ